MMRVVFNADDIGCCLLRDAGVAAARSAGVCRSGSVLVGRVSDGSALLDLGVDLGLHLNLTEGSPVLSASLLPTLCTRNCFFGKKIFFERLAAGAVAMSEIRQELTAQIARFLDLFGVPTHLDGHNHVHVAPGICNIVAELALEHGVSIIRLPKELTPRTCHAGSENPSEALSSFLQMIVVHATAAETIFSRAGLRWPEAFLGLRLMGRKLTMDALCAELLQLHAQGVRTCEVMVHPGLRHVEDSQPALCRCR